MPAILSFEPIYKDKIWGGNKISSILGRKTPEGNIGESWEISDYEEDRSIIQTGIWKGRDFRSIYKMYPREVLGDGFEGLPFPLLVKIIDAKEKLSVQVHPSDEYARKNDPKNAGKKEAWIVMQADPDSNLVVGFAKDTDKKTYKALVESNDAESILRKIPVKPGDSFILEPGTVHAIGAGVLLLEIQQSSDSTYRVYDYGRPRELHLERALDVLSFKASKDKERMLYKESSFAGAGILSSLTENDKFRIFILDVKKDNDYDPEDYILPVITKKPRFHIYSMLDGSIELASGEKFHRGDNFLVTAHGTTKEQIFKITSKEPVKLTISTVGTDWD
ncbi:type I phosphomannose isomerase catalytic subunit [Leptospira sp. GIMC2001]|uniref:type I phosphomannose isomerase catalytic subunit n=1 Tax=Leptospira sp. GIMC2001 TaxID=1513297 RepID=UPI00234AB273|nr:type I phosphomannose isomerase catalytic subunit [Leptospira sp. GIMC2001]WCL51392.1 class I mannose-6-phosphate isomerase [Leptospira sp. GIMC2001]